MALAYKIGLALSILWLGTIGCMAYTQKWTFGRYANTLDDEHAIHCWKAYAVEYGQKKVDACIAQRLTPEENEEINNQTISSYVSHAWKPVAIVLFAPLMIFGFLATWSLLQGIRTSLPAPKI
jgi:hypothetical protein